MRNETLQKIEQELSNINPEGIAMQMELSANRIMDLLIELKKDKKYYSGANKAIISLGHTLEKKVYRAIIAEKEANRKNAPTNVTAIYYKSSQEALEQIKSDLNALLDSE